MDTVTVHNNRLALSAYRFGDTRKPPLLLISSLGADRRMWDGNIDFFSKTHHVVCLDTRGHGRSDAPPAPYGLELLLSDIIAVLDALSIDRTDIVGLSLGGSLALGVALAAPDRVHGIVVCDAQAQSSDAYRAGWDQRIAAVERGGMAAITEGTLSRWFTPDCPTDIVEKARQMLLSTNVAGYAGCASALRELDYLDHLSRIEVPVLYVRGAGDEAAPAAVMEEMHRQTPGSELRTVPAAAHVPNMEKPERFHEALDLWLERSAEDLQMEAAR